MMVSLAMRFLEHLIAFSSFFLWWERHALGTVAEYEVVLTNALGRQAHLRALARTQLKASPLLLGAQQALVHTASCMTACDNSLPNT